MISPQKCLEDFKKGLYSARAHKFLMPVYEKLFKDMGIPINITNEYKKEIKILNKYFKYLNKLKRRNKINFSNADVSKTEVVEKFIRLIKPHKIKEAAMALNEILSFLSRNRTNKNGLEVISWTLFNETRLDDIISNYLNNKEGIRDSLLSFDFLSLFIEYDNFAKTIINDLLIDVELKDPSRRKSIFDTTVFEYVSDEVQKRIPDFNYNPEKKGVDYFRHSTNWLIIEKLTKKINFLAPIKESKKVDMVCKIDKVLFIGTHKEQGRRGGAQDNQANDAKRIFTYSSKRLAKIKEEFNVNKIYLCIILDAEYRNIKSLHWNNIFKVVGQKNNTDKYLLNSLQFIKLVKSALEKT